MDRDEETTNDKGDNATSNTNTSGESPTKRARVENPATSTQPELSCHGSRTLRSDRARKPRAFSQASMSDTFKRVQVSGKSSSVTNQETDRGLSLSQAKRCSSTKKIGNWPGPKECLPERQHAYGYTEHTLQCPERKVCTFILPFH